MAFRQNSINSPFKIENGFVFQSILRMYYLTILRKLEGTTLKYRAKEAKTATISDYNRKI
jgi:hypothetical protein